MNLGQFKYVEGWFAIIYNDKTGLIERIGPFATEEEAKAEYDKQEEVKS